MKKRSFVILLAIAAVPLLLGVSGGTPSSPGYRFARQSAPYTETVAAWMAQNSVEKVAETLTVSPASVEQVRSVFRLMGRRLGTLPSTTSSSSSGIVQPVSVSSEPLPSDRDLAEQQPAVEERIQRQVATVLHRRGVGFKVGDGSFLFPPVLFRFRDLPDLLVVSPRSRIERLGTVLLTPNMPLTDAVKLEGEVSSGGYSALVTHIGGLGVYPSMVPDNSDLRWTTRTVAHEWAHQFLALRPLGWRYAFGAERDPRMVMLNETAAEVIGREVGDEVFAEEYGGNITSGPPVSSRDQAFRDAMRDIRARVDTLLAAGKVNEAETYMEEARQALVGRGYNIRKLNQAYFAFNGSYTDELALGGAVGDDLNVRIRSMRARYSSLGEFVWAISGIGSYEEFVKLTDS